MQSKTQPVGHQLAGGCGHDTERGNASLQRCSTDRYECTAWLPVQTPRKGRRTGDIGTGNNCQEKVAAVRLLKSDNCRGSRVIEYD